MLYGSILIPKSERKLIFGIFCAKAAGKRIKGIWSNDIVNMHIIVIE